MVFSDSKIIIFYTQFFLYISNFFISNKASKTSKLSNLKASKFAQSHVIVLPAFIVRLIRTISLHFIVESQTWYQNDRGVMLISNQSDAKIIGLGSRVIIGLNWP